MEMQDSGEIGMSHTTRSTWEFPSGKCQKTQRIVWNPDWMSLTPELSMASLRNVHIVSRAISARRANRKLKRTVVFYSRLAEFAVVLSPDIRLSSHQTLIASIRFLNRP
jgi:hypothetical protein